MSELVHQLLERNARKYPLEIGVRHPVKDVSLTWQDLNRRANALARHLKKGGVEKGSKVAMLIPNTPEFVVSFFAILKTGAVAVPINVRLTPAEVAYIVNDSDSVAIIYDDNLRAVAEEGTRDSPHQAFAVSTGELARIFAGYSAENLEENLSVFDVAEIIYTSGTTGKPKGVVLSHHAVFSVGSMIAYEGNIRNGDRVLHLMPFTHSAPLNLFLVGATFAGATNLTENFSPQALLEITHRERVTHFFGAPVAYLLASKLPNFSEFDLSSARRWFYGGAPMSREAVLLVSSKFPGDFMSLYGLTEAGPNGIPLHPEEHPRFAGSIGRRGAVNVDIKVVDDGGREVGAGEVGEILIKCPSLMLGYYKKEEATREVLREGWLWTGDVARKDEEGYLWILDRKKDVIISGGVNVYPKEVEDVLARHPGVADVAVVGVPHPDWGETVMAWLVAKTPERSSLEEIQAFCRNHLADFKLPRLVTYTDNIPRNASGKILKNVIKETYLKTLSP